MLGVHTKSNGMSALLDTCDCLESRTKLPKADVELLRDQSAAFADFAAVRGADVAFQKLPNVHSRAGGRLPANDEAPSCSNFGALGEGDGVVDVDTQIPDRVLNVGVAQKYLHSP